MRSKIIRYSFCIYIYFVIIRFTSKMDFFFGKDTKDYTLAKGFFLLTRVKKEIIFQDVEINRHSAGPA